MGGPIVRTGTTPAFWENWDKAFGKAGKSSKKATGNAAAKKPAKSAKSKAAAKGKKKKK
jgi:hypothetical protein